MDRIKETFTTLDISLAAFFEVRGLSAELEFFKNRVIFAFPADDQLYTLLREFNTNSEIKITDYVTVLRTLKGRLLAMKNSHQQGQNKESLSVSLPESLKGKKAKL